MNKLELIQALKDATDLTKPEAAAVVDILFQWNGRTNLQREIGWRSGKRDNAMSLAHKSIQF
jgi:hypothetical protein